MTDKEKIKQEIERIEQVLDDFNKTHNNTIDNGIVSAKKNVCKHLKAFIDSLPEESVSEDLEEEIEIYSNNVHFPICYDDYKRFARHFAEWQKQQMLKDAVECTWGSRATSSFMSDFPNIECGDKVRIIIVKLKEKEEK